MSATNPRTSLSDVPRRVNHGGAAWLRRRGQELIQPQDGASGQFEHRLHQGDGALGQANDASDAEDARMTGSTRSLVSRLTGLNVAVPRVVQATKADFLRVLPRRPLAV